MPSPAQTSGVLKRLRESGEAESIKGVVAIDGKALRGALDKGEKPYVILCHRRGLGCPAGHLPGASEGEREKQRNHGAADTPRHPHG